MGKLIVIEGLDGSGKSTQLDVLVNSLKQLSYNCKSVSFPDYNSNSSALVKMYLSGEFGKNPGDVNAYASSLFYAVDRYASFKKDWQDFYCAGGTVVCGRYVTSNAVHQASKLDKNERADFFEWLYDLEYNKVGIPKPDLVIFLDMPIAVSQKMLCDRYKGDDLKKDIHERDVSYLNKCREAALFAAKYSGWSIVNCAKNSTARAIDDIAAEILELVKKVL